MRKVVPISFTLLLVIVSRCKSIDISKINRRINDANALSAENSPFDSAKAMATELKRQLEYRDQYTNRLTDLINTHPNQPIILRESYSFICFGCVADYVSIFTDGTLYEYTFDNSKKEYLEKSRQMNAEDLIFEGGSYDDIKEIYDSIIADENWNIEPKKYGNENCFDGDQTFYTVFNSKNEISSMYIRCWVPTEFRSQ